MFNLISILIGLVGLGLAVFAFLPFLGWANWAIVPMAIVGLGIGLLSDGKAGRNLNIAVIAIGTVRLMLGGGLF
jgi:hypothetical protein